MQEAIKPLFYVADNDKATALQQAAKDVLYTCLDVSLRLMHPFMPFLSEELYQRLPRRPSEKQPSIMLAPFPESGSLQTDSLAETEVGVYMGVVRAIRSLKTDILKPKQPAKVAVVVRHEKLHEMLGSDDAVVFITTMAKTTGAFTLLTVRPVRVTSPPPLPASLSASL